MKTRTTKSSGKSTAHLGFEAKLWLAADKLRNNMDAAEYKHIVLGLIFLKYISDTFEEHHARLAAGEGDCAGANPEDPDEYKAENVFWVPKEARWSHLRASARQPTIGKIVDDAMVAIERDNPRLKGVLPKDYARPGLDKHRLGELIDLIATIALIRSATGEEIAKADLPPDAGDGEAKGAVQTAPMPSHRSMDLLGRVYEYFLTRFASAEGKNGGQFYTPSCVVRLLVEMLAPHANSRIYDPCCGSGGMFVQSEKFIEAHGGQRDQVAIYGQESNATTRRLAVMNLAIRGISADFGPEHADTFRRDLHPDIRADYVLSNPPFNDSDWFRKDDDARWQFGVPPKGNANFAWVQHFIHHLAPQGMAGFVLANGSMTAWLPFVDANTFTEVDIKVQLKATIAEPADDGQNYEYRLQGANRYNDLRSETISIARILVVLFLPRNAAEWLNHSPDQLALRRCAYWQSLRGSPEITAGSAVIKLPKTQVFSPDGLTQLAARMSRRDFPHYPVE